MSNKAPSFTQIIRTDYFASLAFWFPFLGWAVVAAIFVIFQVQGYWDPECCYEGYQPGRTLVILGFATITFTLLVWLALLWRCQMLQSTFRNGVKVLGVVSNALLYGDRSRFEYNYMHQGHKYTASNVVYKSQRTESLEIGSKVLITLNPDRPKHAFICRVYLPEDFSLLEPTMATVPQADTSADQPESQPQNHLQETVPVIEFHGQYTKHLYYKTVILAALPSKRAAAIRLLMFAGFVVLGLNLVANSMPIEDFLDISSLVIALLVIFMMGYVLGWPYLLAWRAAAVSWKEAKTRAPFEGKVTEQGIVCHTPFSNEYFKWEEFAAVRKFQDVLTLVTDDARLSGHALSFFNSTKDWEKFQQIVTRKVIEAK